MNGVSLIKHRYLKKKNFILNINDITNADCLHLKGVGKNYEKLLVEYHVLYFDSETKLFIDIFENFGKMCLEVY